jgi:IS605 OrfB family transposase
MKRAILLQIGDITARKQGILKEFSAKATAEFNKLWEEKNSCNTFMEFHRKTFAESKKRTGFNVQVYASLERAVWKSKGKAKGITVKFNVPRNCKTFETKTMFFVELGIYPRKRVAVPIKKNRNFQRYSELLKNGWVCKTYGLTPSLQVVAYLSKEEKEIPQRRNVMGIDVNAKHFAISIISQEGKVLYQTYLGKSIWVKRKRIMERRAKLQSFASKGSVKAKRYLRRIKRYERNFVKTNLGQVVREIIKLAKRFDADIAIEKLKRFKPIARKANREIMRIPFYKFKQILEQRCFDNNIRLSVVDSWHTSKWCSHCGALADGHHSANYSLFVCKRCKQVVNSDRKSSLAIAVKCLLERRATTNLKTLQISNRRVPVNGLLRPDEVGLRNVAVQHANQPMESPHFSRG